ncbi:hypothetical protein SGPA1_21632 [Streptomyces misionensis JCM 4497]
MPALLPRPDRRRAEGPLAARHRLRRADHGGRHDRARHRLRPVRHPHQGRPRRRPLRPRRREDVHHQRHQRRPGGRRRPHRRAPAPRAQPDRGRARHPRVRARPQAGEGRPARPGHRRTRFRRRPGAGRQPARRGGRGLLRADPEPRAGAHVGRHRRSGAGVGRLRLDRGVRPRAQGLRQADRLPPGDPAPARRAVHRDRGGPALPRPLRTGPQLGRVDGGRRGQGQVVVHRAPGQGHGRLRPAARRVRLHAGVPDRPCLAGQPGEPDLRGHDRDHEGDHRAFARTRMRGPSGAETGRGCGRTR